MRFDCGYKREDWAEYLGERFKFEIGSIQNQNEIIEKYKDCLDDSNNEAIVWLGDLNIDEEVGVYEIKIKNTKLTTRVKISKICMDIIRTGSRYGKGIFFILYSGDSNETQKYRISYVKYDKKANENFEVEKDLSDTKRFTYLLGEGAKVKTATSRLTKEAFSTVKKIEEAFSVEPVNKEFYNGIKKLFDKIYKDVLKNFYGCEILAKEFSLRFLGRALFCWFLREKDLIPKEIFDFKIYEEVKDNPSVAFEELFFNVLNVKMEDRKFYKGRSMIIKKYQKQIPFLNGGLFSRQENDDKIKLIDNEIIKELFEFFNLYNFTVDESAPFDIEISIEPEMLGRIFENLLAEINPTTSESARKETGSFYTPREIVDYMVCESIKLYLKKKVEIPEGTPLAESEKIEKIFSIENETEYTKEEASEILKAIHEMKILDIACGSGAFPIGILQRVFMIIDKLDESHEFYKELLLKNIKGQAKKEFEKLYESKKFDYAYKLYILQNMIHGVDIQPIAIEISRLRAFLSLIVEEEKDESEDNLGIKPLPNLEFNFISANSLISLENKSSQKGFEDKASEGFIESMRNIAEEYFNADSLEKKEKIKYKFDNLQARITHGDDFLTSENKKKFSSWNPFENKPAAFFDSEIQFGIKSFDIVIGNPPYGAKLTNEEKKIYKSLFKYTTQGEINTYKLFIEKGFDLLKKNGNLIFIVPMSITSSLSNIPLHKMLLENCELIKISSYGYRPNQIFRDVAFDTSILQFIKTYSKTEKLLTTKINKRYREQKIQDLIDNLKFVNSINLLKEGRIPKISYQIEADILSKLYRIKTTIADLLNETKGAKPIYWRKAGGLYYKIVTSFPTNTNTETSFYFLSKHAKLVGAIMSSTLYYWRWLANSDWHNIRAYEVLDFPIPIDKFTNTQISEIEKIYKEYEKDLIKNSKPYRSKGEPAYYARKSKHIIDKIDRLICPLYNLTEEETEFIIGYELEFRV